MNIIKEKYKLSKNLTREKLNDAGFRHYSFRRDLFKGMVTLLITIEPDEDDYWWTYQVLNSDAYTLYIPYYNRLTGVNDVVKNIDEKITNIFKELVEHEIFYIG